MDEMNNMENLAGGNDQSSANGADSANGMENRSGSGEAAVDYSTAAGTKTSVGGSTSAGGSDTGGSGYNTYTYDTSSDASDQYYGEQNSYTDTDSTNDYSGYGQENNQSRESSAYNDASGSQYGGAYNDGYSAGGQYGGYYGGNNGFNGAAGGQFNAVPPQAPKKKKKLSEKAKKVLAAVLVIALCGCAGFGGTTLANNMSSSSSGSGSSKSTNVKISGDVTSLDAASAIAEKIMPSVVGISTTSQTKTQTLFGLQSGTVEGVGTGIIVSEDGYILTNSHVVNDGDTETITVDLYDGKTYSGKVLWNDSSLDLAIVKIDASGLTAAELGDSDDVKIGDYALAVGNPLGLNYERSMTSGIISGLNRTITTQDESTGSTNNMEGLIQTDAAINSGNSGGPLIDSEGKVIGINTAKASSSEGLGFSIPINTAVPIIKQIKENGDYQASYIGISGVDLSDVMANYQTNFKADSGVYVAQIFTDSPAAKAGLKEGDIITKINDKEISGMSALKSELINYSPGTEITLTVERDKKDQKIKLTLGSESDAKTSLQSSESQGQSDQNGSSGSQTLPGISGGQNGQSGQSGQSSSGGLGSLFGN
ncbi:MAG: trypsin-like peptidase domain-containing protein [Anaerovoracaceae bacterium]|nr:trypsin-like peptidase domain-containing protein [Bacillota bacterium]MDY2670726.1 trypsin-like peptidase domain-containing protein [Anaerovoracaceae bacterium]